MPWQEAEESILACTAQIMDQAVQILRSGLISDSSFQYESKIIAGSSPGKHLRHVLDHLRILLDAIESWQSRIRSSNTASTSRSSQQQQPELIVDYDSRVMSKVPDLETSSERSLREFEHTVDRLYSVFEGSRGTLYGQKLKLCATTPFVVDMESTVGRELWFCGLHAIHHYALARVILVKELELDIDPQFGVAPSTLVHRQWRRETTRAGPASDVPSKLSGPSRTNNKNHQDALHQQHTRARL